ncbi:keratin, type I cytoskeletal 9-like [Salvia hispanica]|uniref:keratin, type I cytoskeletal 9-like n=1 Tax=Salvia hispanica TaxID=49212 RepID=UPI0020096CDB|nr:keratin, type I cytoskeletal 9-like [Salvia hispanica]
MPPANPDQTGATNGDSSSSGGVGFGLGDRNKRLSPQSAPLRTGEQTPHSTAENAAVSGGISIERSRSSGGDRRIEEVGKAAFAGRIGGGSVNAFAGRIGGRSVGALAGRIGGGRGGAVSGEGGYQDEEDNWAWH